MNDLKKLAMKRYACVIGLFVLFLMHCQAERNEPQCYSRFDYDMKMFETVAEMKQKQKALMSSLTDLQDQIERLKGLKGHFTESGSIDVNRKQGEIGETYVRWGSLTCPDNGADLVYRGFMGGGFYNSKGEGANFQCLPDSPSWGTYQDSKDEWRSLIYGAEYESGLFKFNREVPCVVCLTPRSSTLMIPARTSCFSGWTLEYEGILVSARSDHTRSQYACVDKEQEVAPGSDPKNQDGALFYQVEGRCGSLHCPPYVDGRELACVVCSK